MLPFIYILDMRRLFLSDYQGAKRCLLCYRRSLHLLTKSHQSWPLFSTIHVFSSTFEIFSKGEK